MKSRSHGRKRAYFYGCTSYHLRGTSVCKNAIEVPMATADRAVLDAFDKVLTPTVLDKVLDAALKQLTAAPKDAAKRRKELEQQLAAVTVESGRLTEALASGGDISVIVVALKDRQARQEALQEEIARLSDVAIAVDPERLRRLLHERLTDWRGVLTRQIPQARQILKKLMDGPVIFQPVKEGIREGWRFSGTGKLAALLHGTEVAKILASPTGFANMWKRKLAGIMRRPARWSRIQRLKRA